MREVKEAVGDQSRFCKFHKAFGHPTEQCRNLARELSNMAQKGLLDDFVVKIQTQIDHSKGKDAAPGDESSDKKARTQVINTIAGGPSDDDWIVKKKNEIKLGALSISFAQ